MDYFKRFLFVSALLHLSVGLVWLVQNFLFPRPVIEYQKAIRIDVIGLPDKVISIEPPKQEEIEQQSSMKKNLGHETPIEKGVRKSVSQAKIPARTNLAKGDKLSKNNLGSSKLSQLSALDKLEKSMAEEEGRNRLLKQMIFKGNAIVEGSSITGLNKIEAEDYVGLVESHVRSFWRLPQWLASSRMRAKALVKWDSRGMPILIQIIESSGNDEFDQVVMETLQKAVPLPEPPEKFALIMRRQGVIFGFPE